MKVLVTGDDGYRALGLRIVATVLKEKGFDVKIAATKDERSSTGGSFPGHGRWGKDTVEGVEALWVDGMPADSVEVANYYYGDNFDFVVSGMNMGANLGAISASGTLGAAFHSLDRAVAKKAVALSWRLPQKLVDDSAVNEPIDKYEHYPKKTVRELMELILKNNFWGADILNCNLPENPPSKLLICAPMISPNARYYGYSLKLDEAAKTYEKIGGPPQPQTDPLTFDGAALAAGNLTVVPWLANRYVNPELLKLIGTEITLKGKE